DNLQVLRQRYGLNRGEDKGWCRVSRAALTLVSTIQVDGPTMERPGSAFDRDAARDQSLAQIARGEFRGIVVGDDFVESLIVGGNLSPHFELAAARFAIDPHAARLAFSHSANPILDREEI